MTCEVVVEAEADAQILAIGAWWLANRGTTSAFADELDLVLKRLAQVPEIGPPFKKAQKKGVRRILLPESQHWVYYLHDARHHTVHVWSVRSTARRGAPKLPRRLRAIG